MHERGSIAWERRCRLGSINIWEAAACFALAIHSLCAYSQDNRLYSRRQTLSSFIEYSNTSSHILLGVEQNRRLGALGFIYSRRLHHSRTVDWYYDLEVRPVVFIQNPVAGISRTIQFAGFPTFGPFPVQSGPIQRRCISSTYPDPNAFGQSGVSVTLTQICSAQWTYAGGVSPLGQRLNFGPRHRLQPFAQVNAGFLASTHDIPSNETSRFNFTFEFGGGLEFFRDARRAWGVEYHVHHLSNANSGINNGGIDSQMLKLTYSLGR